MEIVMVALVLLAALLHALWNAIVKSGGDGLMMLAGVIGVTMLAGALAIPVVPAPNPQSWVFIGLSVLVHAGYYFALVQAYRVGDLSHVYPVSRGMAPLWVLFFAALAAGEYPPVMVTAGIVVASAGILSLAFEDGLPWRGNPRPLLFALATSVCIAGYTLADGLGVRASGAPLGYIAWMFFLNGFSIVIFAALRRRSRAVVFLATRWRIWLFGGLAATTAYGVVIYAMNQIPMAMVSALRETSVIMAALIGVFFMSERLGARRIVAAILVAVGVVVMQLA